MAGGRVLVTTFASNAARLQTIGRVAREAGRQVCIAGRSLERILRVAQATGYLTDFPPPIGFDEAMRLPRGEVLIIGTGGQGEPRAALGRIASGTHELKLGEGDTVIFSSRIIPGNEVAIGRIMNQLSDLGVHIVTEKQAHVHVSGHPGRPELDPDVQMGAARDRRSGARRSATPRRACPARARSRRRACGRPEERRRDPPRTRRSEEGRRGPRRTARARRRRHPAGRRSDGERAPKDRLWRADQRRGSGRRRREARRQADDPPDRRSGRRGPRRLHRRRDRCRDTSLQPGGDEDQTREAVRLAVRRCATLWTGKKPVVEVMLLQVAA